MELPQNATAPPRINVLICNSENGTRQVLRRWLGRVTSGDIDEAETAAGAFEQLSRARSDLLLVDLDLPDIDGLRMLKMIRTTPALDLLNIGVLSHRRTEETVRAALQAGVAEYLLKPLAFDTAIHRLTRLVQLADKRIRQGERDKAPGPEPRRQPVVLLAGRPEDKDELTPGDEDPRWKFIACRSASETIINVQRRKPDIVMLSHVPQTLAVESFAKKLGKLGHPRKQRIVLLGDSPAEAIAGEFERVARPDTREAVTVLVARLVHEYHEQQVPARERLWRDLRKRLLLALGAFFATYTGSEPEATEDAQEYGRMWGGGMVRVTAQDGSFGFQIWLAADRPALGAVARSMFEEDQDDPEDDMLIQVVGELLNSAAGGAKTIAEEARIPVQVGIPEVDEENSKPEIREDAESCGTLDWNGTGAWGLWLAATEGGDGQ